MSAFNKEKLSDTLQKAVFKFTYSTDTGAASAAAIAGVTSSIAWTDLSYGLSGATASTSKVDISKIIWSVSNANVNSAQNTVSPALAVSWGKPATAMTGGTPAFFLSGNGAIDFTHYGMVLSNPLTGNNRINQIDIYNSVTTTQYDAPQYSIIIEVDKVSGFGITG